MRNAAADRDLGGQIELLGQLFNEGGRALVEPLDRPSGDISLMVGWRVPAAPLDHPIFIRGDARDYFCLRPNRFMIVYSEADLTELGRFHPDFHAIEVPRIIFNRAHDRGFVKWSAGWTGGTYRLRLVNGAWILDTISSGGSADRRDLLIPLGAGSAHRLEQPQPPACRELLFARMVD